MHGIRAGGIIVALLMFCFIGVSACSREKSAEKEKAAIKPSTQQTVDAVRDIGRRPIDAAKKAQAQGQSRAEGIDKEMEKMGK